jgi:hypothetical protein
MEEHYILIKILIVVKFKIINFNIILLTLEEEYI